MIFQARLVTVDGSGQGVSGEGRALARSDVSAITCAVYDLDSAAPATPVATPAVVVGTNILAALTADDTWLEQGGDATGGNFRQTLPGTTFAHSHQYRIVYTLTLVGGKAETTIVWAHTHTAIAEVPDS